MAKVLNNFKVPFSIYSAQNLHPGLHARDEGGGRFSFLPWNGELNLFRLICNFYSDISRCKIRKLLLPVEKHCNRPYFGCDLMVHISHSSSLQKCCQLESWILSGNTVMVLCLHLSGKSKGSRGMEHKPIKPAKLLKTN